MRAWSRQECKDFRIVFISENLEKEQEMAFDYAKGFVKAIGLDVDVILAKQENDVPKAKFIKILKDTSGLTSFFIYSSFWI